MKESIPITVFGQSFSLRSSASADEVRRVADFVNQAIAEVVATHRVADSLHIVLLAFLNVAQSYLQLQNEQQGDQQELANRLNRLMQIIAEEIGAVPNNE